MNNENLIKTLYDCAAKCFHCADACLEEDNVKMMVRCIRLDRICAATCVNAAQAITVGGDQEDVRGLLEYCREICEKCAEECDKHEHQHCKDCAQACQECAEACASF